MICTQGRVLAAGESAQRKALRASFFLGLTTCRACGAQRKGRKQEQLATAKDSQRLPAYKARRPLQRQQRNGSEN